MQVLKRCPGLAPVVRGLRNPDAPISPHGDPTVAALATALVRRWRALVSTIAPLASRAPAQATASAAACSENCAPLGPRDDAETRRMRSKSIEHLRSAISRPAPTAVAETAEPSSLKRQRVGDEKGNGSSLESGSDEKVSQACLWTAREIEREVFEGARRSASSYPAATSSSSSSASSFSFDGVAYQAKVRTLVFNLGRRGDASLRLAALRFAHTFKTHVGNSNSSSSSSNSSSSGSNDTCLGLLGLSPAQLATMSTDALASPEVRAARAAVVEAANAELVDGAAVQARNRERLAIIGGGEQVLVFRLTCPSCGKGTNGLEGFNMTQDDSYWSARTGQNVTCTECGHSWED